MRDGRHSLVLAGGANRGAYQAGVIGGLVARDGLRDGEPLGFAAVCGTSIGALNGYFVATAQYARLRELWREVATRDVFRLKPTFERIPEPSAGVATRAYEAISLGFGLIKNVRGILDSAPIVQLLDENVQPATDAVHIPLYIATTNLTRRRGQLFVREATTPDGRHAASRECAAHRRLRARFGTRRRRHLDSTRVAGVGIDTDRSRSAKLARTPTGPPTNMSTAA